MIWESIALMTVIDVVIVLTAFASVWIVVTHRNTLVQSNLIRGFLLVVVGLLMVALFYLADLFIMFGLPLLIPRPAAMRAMEDLHLNYSWVIMLVGMGCILTGFALTNRWLFSLIDRLKRSEAGVSRELTERKREDEENKALAQVGRALSQSLDLEEVGQRIVDSVRSLLGAQAAVLYRQQPTSGDLVRLAVSGEIGPTSRQNLVFPRGTGLAGLAVSEKRPMVTANLLSDSRITLRPEARAWTEQAPFRAGLALPLMAKDTVIGALGIGDCPGRVFTDEDVRLAQAFADHAALALENARLFAESEAQRRAAEALLEIARALGSTLEPKHLMKVVAQRTAQAVGAERCSINLWRQGHVVPVMSQFADGHADPHLWAKVKAMGPYRLEEVPAHAEAIRTKQPVVVEDATSNSLVPAYWLGVFGIRSALVVPLVHQEEVIGTLNLDRTKGPYPWRQDQVDLAMTIANQAGLAVENARLFEETERRRREAESLAEVGQLLSQSLDPEEVGQQIVRSVLRLFAAQSATLYKLEPVSGDLISLVVSGETGPVFGPHLVFARGTGVVGLALREHHPVTTPNLLTDSRISYTPEVRERIEQTPFRAILAVPLVAKGRAIGALGVGDRLGRVFTDEEVQLAQSFADQAAIALENARLFDESESRQGRLESLLEVGRQLSRFQRLESLLGSIAEACGQLLSADAAGFRVVERDDLVVTGMWGEAEEVMATPRIKIGQSLTGIVAATGEPLIVRDPGADPRLVPAHAEADCRLGYRAFLGVPVKVGERVRGVLAIRTRREQGFSQNDLEIATAFASQAAVALENARLYEEVRDARDFLQSIAENSAAAIVTTDDNGRVTYFSPGAEEIFGYRAEEVVGQPAGAYYRSGQEARALMSRLRAEARIKNYETVMGAKDGRWVEVNSSLSLLRDASGGVVGTLAVMKDITERKRAEEALRESEERFRKIFDEGPLGMAIVDLDYRFVKVNSALCRMLGYSALELTGRTFPEITHPEDIEKDVQLAEEVFSGQIPHSQLEKRYIRKNGEILWVSLTAAVIRDESSKPLYGLAMIEDITERKRAEVELQRHREARTQSEKMAAMGEMLAGVAHELNNPLAVVLGHVALFRRTAGAGPPIAPRVEKIAQAAQRCARIVKNFLALARQYPAERQQVQLNQVVREAVELLAYQLRVDDVEVTLNLAGDLPALWADPHQLHQVTVNLITNAHQAMHQSRLPRQLTLTTRFDSGQGRVALEVADTGPGIPPEIRAQIFDPFFTTKPPGQGTGLGLSLCHGLVESHGGTIRVESQPGRGAVFVTELPLVAPPVVPAAAGPAAASLAPAGTTILVVEDEQEMAGVLAEMLAADGHEVETAADGAMALDRLRERAYEVIVSDIRMPNLDGPGLFRELERSHPGLWQRVVFITGDQLNPATREFLEATEAPKLGKPFDQADLRRAIEQVLRPAGAA